MKKTKYLIFKPETGCKKAGTWPQTTIQNLTREQLDIIDNFNAHDLPAVMPDFNNLCFDRDAKITDLVSNNFFDFSKGVLINEKIKTIVDSCKLINYDFFETRISRKNDPYLYFFLYIRDSVEIIDFPQSTFGEGDILGRPQGPKFKLNSIVELKEKNLHLSETTVGGSVIQLAICLKQEIDILRIPYKSALYISEKLNQRLLDERISGFNAKESQIEFFI